MPSNEENALHTLGLTAARWHAILDTAQDAIICITPRRRGHAVQRGCGADVRLRSG